MNRGDLMIPISEPETTFNEDHIFDLDRYLNEKSYPAPHSASPWLSHRLESGPSTSSTVDYIYSHSMNLEADDDQGSYLDPSDMPATREPSLEPVMRVAPHYRMDQEYLPEQRHAHGQDFRSDPSVNPWTPAPQCGWTDQPIAQQNQVHRGNLPRMSSREPPLQRDWGTLAQAPQIHQPPQPHQTPVIIVPQPVFVAHPNANVMLPMRHGGMTPYLVDPMNHGPSGLPIPEKELSRAQTSAIPPSAMQGARGSMPPAPDPEPNLEPAPQQESQTGVPHAKQRGKAKTRGQTKDESVFDKLSVEQKEALCKYIYDFMVNKKLTSEDGYLVVDIFSEVWKDMDATAESWRVAQHRFGDLLSFAPQYFRLFRKSIRVANPCGWFTRKGQKMVRLVPA
jgi:hypothetical protein